MEQVGLRDGDLLKERGVNPSGSHGVKVQNCKPYPVACTRGQENVDRALQGQRPGPRPEHSRSE